MIDGLRRSWRLRSSLLIVLIDFGPGKLSERGSAIGRRIGEFRRNVRDETSGQRAAERARTPETCRSCVGHWLASDVFRGSEFPVAELLNVGREAGTDANLLICWSTASCQLAPPRYPWCAGWGASSPYLGQSELSSGSSGEPFRQVADPSLDRSSVRRALPRANENGDAWQDKSPVRATPRRRQGVDGPPFALGFTCRHGEWANRAVPERNGDPCRAGS
jgi:hypothetical protein